MFSRHSALLILTTLACSVGPGQAASCAAGGEKACAAKAKAAAMSQFDDEVDEVDFPPENGGLSLIQTKMVLLKARDELPLLAGEARKALHKAEVIGAPRPEATSLLEIDPTTGAWDSTDIAGTEQHVYSKCLSHGLGALIQKKGAKSALDLGAGLGHYSAAVDMLGVAVTCYDGNPASHGATAQMCNTLDLSQRNVQGPLPADFAWSLEVGEHIPKAREQDFLDNVARLAKQSALVSWAVPGQGGHGHVNEQTNEYIINEFKKRGFSYDDASSQELRQAAGGAGCCCGWFHNTLLVFDRTSPPALLEDTTHRLL